MLPSNRLETVFFVLGLIVGALFVLDGWRGSPKTRDFKSSPRMKAAAWAVGGLLGALLLDVKRIGVTLPEDKLGICWEYLFGFSIAAMVALSISTLTIFVQSARSHSQRKPTLANATGFPFLPITDYLHYGYDRFREIRDAAIDQVEVSEADAQRRYLITYSGELATAVASLNHFRETGGDSYAVARLILRSIAQLTESQLHLSTRLNVNYMRAYPAQTCPPTIKDRARFVYGDPTRYTHYLALVQYASDVEREVFSLPVEPMDHSGKLSCVLPGAPVSFRTSKMVYIEDTTHMDYPASLDRTIVTNLKEYFAGKKFKSFLSIPILGGDGTPLGVLNIDSNQKKAFGTTEEERESILITVLPFCSLLSAIISPGVHHD
jgi:hypothetical protein